MNSAPQAQPTGGIFSPERRSLTVGVLLAIGAFAVEGMGVVPALPRAIAELHGMDYFGWAFTAFMLAWLVGTVAGGQFADARGPRLPMGLGLFGFTAGLFLAGWAQAMPQFLAGRALQGIGGGCMISAAYVAIARGYPDDLRARMMAATSSVWVLPAVVGPAASGAVTEWSSWRYVFLGVVPVIAMTALIVLPPLRRFDLSGRMSVGKIGAALRTAVGTGLMLSSPRVFRFGWAASAALLVVGALVFMPALRTILPRGTLSARRGLPAGLLSRGILAAAFFGTEAFVPLGATELRGASATRAGIALTAAALGWVSATWLQERLEAQRGAIVRSRVMGIGFFLLAVGIVMVAAALLSTLPFFLILIGWAVAGSGIGLAYAAGSLLCIAQAPAGQEGEVSGQLQLAEAVSNAMATGTAGAILAGLTGLGYSRQLSFAAIFALTWVLAIVGAMLAPRSSA